MIPFASAEPSCESRLNHSAVQIIFEKGLQHGATSLASLSEFATSSNWYNPFASARATLAGPKFISAFDQITRQMSAEERAQVKLSLQEFLVKQNALNAIVHENAKATETILTAFLLPPLDIGSLTPDSDDVGLVTLEERPVLFRRMRHGPFEMIVLLDPFNPHSAGKVRTIMGSEHAYRTDHPVTFENDGEVYAFYPKNLVFYNLSREGAGPKLPHYLNKAQIVRTPDGPAVIGDNQMQMVFENKRRELFPYEFDVDDNTLVSVSSVGNRDIVTAAGSQELFFRDLSGKEQFKPHRFRRYTKVKPLLAPIVFEDAGDLLAAQVLQLGRDEHHVEDEYHIEVIDIRKNILLQKITLPGRFISTTKLAAIKVAGHTKLVFETISKDRNATTVHAVNPRTGEFRNGQPIVDPLRQSRDEEYGFHEFEALGRTMLISGGPAEIYIFDPSNGAFETFRVPGQEGRLQVFPFTYQGISYAFVDSGGFSPPRLIQLTINKK